MFNELTNIRFNTRGKTVINNFDTANFRCIFHFVRIRCDNIHTISLSCSLLALATISMLTDVQNPYVIVCLIKNDDDERALNTQYTDVV